MDWWIYVTNVAVGGVTWALTRFGIPFVNREAHLDIPVNAETESELGKLVKQIWDKEIITHLMRHHAIGVPVPPPTTPPSPTYTFATTTSTAPPPPPAATPNPDPNSGVTNG